MKKEDVYDKIHSVFGFIILGGIFGFVAILVIFCLYMLWLLASHYPFHASSILGAIILIVIAYNFFGKKVRSLLGSIGIGISLVLGVIFYCFIIFNALKSVVENISVILLSLFCIAFGMGILWLVL